MESDTYEDLLRGFLDDIRIALTHKKASVAIKQVQNAYLETARRKRDFESRKPIQIVGS